MAEKNGRDIFTSSPDEIASEFARLSTNDKEFHRAGVADKLRAATGHRLAEAVMRPSPSLKNLVGQESNWHRFSATSGEFDKFVDTGDFGKAACSAPTSKPWAGSADGRAIGWRRIGGNNWRDLCFGAADIGKSAAQWQLAECN